jgi:hypothetical protein
MTSPKAHLASFSLEKDDPTMVYTSDFIINSFIQKVMVLDINKSEIYKS